MGYGASILEALGHAHHLDEDLWSKLFGKWGKLDVSHAGEHTSPPSMDLSGMERLLSIACSQYEVICVDLASSLDPISIALMRESRRIYMVTTPEVVAIHFAAERVRTLQKLGLDERSACC